MPGEFAASLTPGEDPEPVSDEELSRGWDEDAREARFVALEGNKIGGTPGFVQSEEYPRGGPWNLLLQFDMTEVPFHVNFGDAGVGYAFISENAETGKFLWQCY